MPLTVESPGLKNYLQLFHSHLSVESLLVPKASSCSPAELNVSTMLQAHPNTCSLQAYVLQSNGAQGLEETIHQSVIP